MLAPIRIGGKKFLCLKPMFNRGPELLMDEHGAFEEVGEGSEVPFSRTVEIDDIHYYK